MSHSSSEEEEEIEEALAGPRTPVPASVMMDLLRSTPSRSPARSNRSGTNKSAAKPQGKSGLSLSTTVTPEKRISPVNAALTTPKPAAAASSAPRDTASTRPMRQTRSHDVGEGPSITVTTRSTALNDTHGTHGPRENLDEPLFIDLVSSASSTSSHSPVRIAKHQGAPYVEVPYLPLHRLKQYHKPESRRYPTWFSRNDQLRYHQTPPPSPGESDFAERRASPLPRPTRAAAAARAVPRWKTRTDTESSPDLGVNGFDESSASDTGSADSDLPVRRSMRSKGKEKEVRARRGAKPLRSYRIADFVDSSRSTSREVRAMPTRHVQPERSTKGKRKRDVESSSDVLDIGSGEDELESEYEELEESEYSESDKRSRAKGKGRQEPKERDEDVFERHRSFCEKCGRGPANEILRRYQARKKKKPGRRKRKHEDELSDDEIAEQLGGWLECKRCVVAAHWGCLADKQRKDVLVELQAEEGPVEHGRRKIRSVGIEESAAFRCLRCEAGGKCMACHQDKLATEQIEGDGPAKSNSKVNDDKPASVDTGNQKEPTADGTEDPADSSDIEIVDKDGRRKVVDLTNDDDEVEDSDDDADDPLRFRCVRCKQEAHYEHLPDPFVEDDSLAEIARYYQLPTEKGNDGWQCHQCRSWIWTVDMIIAWRPLPADAKEELDPDEPLKHKSALPREYLVKWVDRGFRHATWVPHAWLLANSSPKLKNFLIKGPSLDLVTDETLAARGDDMAAPTIANIMDEADQAAGTTHHKGDQWKGAGPPPDVEGYESIPAAWKTVDRVLDIMLLPPPTRSKGKKAARRSRSASVFTADQDAADTMDDGIWPGADQIATIDEWEDKTGHQLGPSDVDQVAKLVTWCFIKWDDLQYDQSTWNTPPPRGSPLYPAFKRALERYLAARQVEIPILSRAECDKREIKAGKFSKPPDKQPVCVVGGKLMPFQINGFQWLLTKHFKRESCILADDMGLGKTVQIASLLGYLGSSAHKIYPFLVVVPNSTITNWVREFEKWVPHMRVVPYYGEKASRKIVHKYELYHIGQEGKTAGLKAHVVLTTYDTITSSEFGVFKAIPRWEMLVVDEGQRLKSDNNLIFNRLKALNSVHRILLTGTPLNNNLRELFNLLNFLDPVNFRYLEDLEAKYENLNENLLAELHEMIQPYILRRIKADVLRLPPKVEIIVPISLTPIQKHLYRSVLEKNADLIQALLQQRKKKAKVSIAGGGPVRAAKDKVNGNGTDSAAGQMQAGPSGTRGNTADMETVAVEPPAVVATS